MFTAQFFTLLSLTAAVLGAPVAQFKPRQSCSGMQLVHVAGTFEVGLGLVGTPLSKSLASAVPGTTTKSITYDTSAEYVATVAAGAAITQNYLKSQAASCPDQKYVLSGYSKGALVLHGMNLDAGLKSKVSRILVFGDPMRNIQTSQWPINSPSVDLAPRDGSDSSQNVASFCNTGDLFCFVPGTSLPAHLAYGTDGSIDVAANFVKGQA